MTAARPTRTAPTSGFTPSPGTRGQAVTIESNGINFNDAPVRLYDPNLALAASNDGGSGDSLISNYVLALTGLYTIAVSPYSPGITSATISLSLTGSAGSLGALAQRQLHRRRGGRQDRLGLFSTSTS